MNDQSNDFRVVVKVQNGRLWDAIKRCGFESVKAFSEASDVHMQTVYKLLAMQLSPLDSDGKDWRPSVKKLCEFTGDIPEDLFPESIPVVPINTAAFYASADDVQDMIEHRLSAKKLVAVFSESWTPKEKKVLEYRAQDMTLDDVGEILGVGRERVRQIEAKALRRARVVAGMKHLDETDA